MARFRHERHQHQTSSIFRSDDADFADCDMMSEDNTPISDVLFKSNKRRKIFRRRKADDEQDDNSGIHNREDDPATVDDEEVDDTPSLVKRPNMKKRGINFSSTGRLAADAANETAVVPYEERQSEDIVQTDRFIKPSGGVRVVEDKHLTAYVDSKLAELRSSPYTPSQQQAEQLQIETADDAETRRPDPNEPPKNAPSIQRAEGTREGPRKGYPYGSRPQHQRPRRQPPPRDQTSIARESMVDQILAETEVPMYDLSAPAAPNVDASALDADDAAAEAFKAEFFAGLAERNRRRPPAVPAGAKRTQVSKGPKLGGSRSQREKMKALEETKNTAGKK